MNTLYFTIFETRQEHLHTYSACWNSLLANVDRTRARVVINNCGASPELLERIPKELEVRCSAMTGLSGVWMGIGMQQAKWLYSSEGEPEDTVIFSDARDMVFQRDPFLDIQNVRLVAAGEGPIHAECPWNTADQSAIQSYLPTELRDDFGSWPIICNGVSAGKRQSVRNLLLGNWLMGSLLTHGGTDQGVTNYLWNRYLGKEPGSWLCHPGISDWCLNGHHAPRVSPAPYLQDGQVMCAATNKPYALFHQWERTQWREQMLKQWT